jgi:phosphatidylserine decarboxylase
MNHVFYLDRKTQKVEEEKIYGQKFIELLYGDSFFSSVVSKFLLPLCVKVPYLSRVYGSMQRHKRSIKKIAPFVAAYRVKLEDFIEPHQGFNSFNDFFIRALKPGSREIVQDKDRAILPADGRYLVFSNLSIQDQFFIKGQKLSLTDLVPDPIMRVRYAQGSMVFARLCPSDYHRFHFPCACRPSKAQLVQGSLYSVNPMALRRNIKILSQNKRVLTELETECFGTILYIEVGATAVGSIQQTYEPLRLYQKGDEKGFFQFGGSTVLMLFEPNKILFDEDLLQASKEGIEVKANMGESLGRVYSL